MSAPGWTPGPWRVGKNPLYVLGADDRGVVFDVDADIPEVVASANARLIAAAPELFDALASIAAVFCGNGTREDYDNAYRERGIAAINKALGRT